MIKPSNIALTVSGLLIGYALILIYIEYVQKRTPIIRPKLIELVLFLATSISIHGLLHMGAEINYNYNPLEGKFTY